MALPKGHCFNYFTIAGNLHPLESLLVYCLALGVVFAPPELKDLFWTNCLVQLCIFLPFVQLPVALTGHMTYVDIGWPSGLVAIGVIALVCGTGDWWRRSLISACYLLHGGRMALGALVLFGQATKFTFRFQEDLPRYCYAKYKWTKIEGMPARMWWLKMQQETFGQGMSNCILLCLPAFLAAANPQPGLHLTECLGLATWLLGWIFESSADAQKLAFVAETKRLRYTGHPHACQSTLGMPPFEKYFLWRWCRHPNYFGEWMAWLGLAVAAAPSLGQLAPKQFKAVWFCYLVALILIPRLLYDCLVHWTGAGPAEHFSVQKRPAYLQYQKEVRCFFPFPLPLEHHCKPGWPTFEQNR
ncbi:unnamed protein product [Effrenium voratum]|uniref:Steroid 5-alpha reductase C-terminal domain-containing protein n=1 Tax=Effrenium voratum TaxID=2562239 RepID=A0AA36MST1_9DINO|nr:unnamed protein product [Effrenium voratum]